MQSSNKTFSYKDSQTIRLANIWNLMHQRCYLPSHRAYTNYGERGIAICDEWRDSFEPFRIWALANGYNNDLTIDRIDNDKGYSPENCRWISRQEQLRNKRNNVNITAFGETKCVADWITDPRCECSSQQLVRRIHEGMPPEEAIRLKSQKQYFRSATKKQCGQCGKIKNRTEFYLSGKPGPEPHRPWCKLCESEYAHDHNGSKTRYKRLYKGETERECSECRKVKPNNAFYPISKKKPDVPCSRCIECFKAYFRERSLKAKQK